METDSSLTQVTIEDQMKEAYLEYAMSVIVGRALPDVRDGMKPVHRRVLFAMYDMGNTYDKAYRKSARIVGDVIGKYHPHGDLAVYETMVRMAQDFSMRYMLIDGQGNFGSIDGDSAAAMRYTEVRLAKIANQVLADIEKETVDFTPNYDNSLKEPTVLPTRVPTLLIDGAAGIAVGMATNIPPHNLGEVIDGLKALIKNPGITIPELLEIIPGPDFPTAAYISGRSGLREAYTTGKGIIQLRAKTEIEDVKGEKQRIIVTELPYQVNKAKLIEAIADHVRNKKIEGISDIRDESDRKGMRVVFDLKKGEDSRVILNQLYKNTSLKVSFGINFLALDHQQPKLMNLKEILVAFLTHRKVIVTRRTVFELRKAEERAHILEALKKAVENLDDVVALIRQAENPGVAQEKLMAKYQFSEVQAKAILEMRLQRLTGLEREKIVSEYKEILLLIAELKGILSDENKVLTIIENELDEVRTAFADKRRTQFLDDNDEELTDEDLIADEPMVVTVTFSGYIKRLPTDTYRSQKRGGRGIMGAGTKAEDFIQDIFVANTLEQILCFTDRGRVYWLKVFKVPEASRTARGRPIINLLNLSTHERIQAVLPIKAFNDNEFVVMITKKGITKKTPLSAFAHPLRKGIIAVSVDDGDTLVDAKITNGSQNILLVTKLGQSIRFHEEDAPPKGRSARGAQGMRIDTGDEIVGLEIISPNLENAHILTVTEKGYGKRTLIQEYPLQNRGGSGVITIKITDKNGPVVAVRQVVDQDQLIIASDHGKVIRTRISEISEVGRNTQGVRLINLEEGESVAAVAKVDDDESKPAEPNDPNSSPPPVGNA